MAEAPSDDGLPTAFRGKTVTQFAFLVTDLPSSVSAWTAILGRADWLVYSYNKDTVPDLSYRGSPASFAIRLALSGTTPQIELIQPLEGPSIYHDWIDLHGYGAHHIGFHVSRAKPVIEQLATEGLEPVQAGSGYGADGSGGFAYFDLVDPLGLYLEVIEAPMRRRPSEPL